MSQESLGTFYPPLVLKISHIYFEDQPITISIHPVRQ